MSLPSSFQIFVKAFHDKNHAPVSRQRIFSVSKRNLRLQEDKSLILPISVSPFEERNNNGEDAQEERDDVTQRKQRHDWVIAKTVAWFA